MLNQKLLTVSKKYECMKQFIIQKMESNEKWRKQYKKKKKLVRRSYKKTEIPDRIKNLLHEFDMENNVEDFDELQNLRRKGDSIASGLYNGQSMVNTAQVRKKKSV